MVGEPCLDQKAVGHIAAATQRLDKSHTKVTLLPPARLTSYSYCNLPKECHLLGTKCSNTQGNGKSSNDKQTHTSNMYYIINCNAFTLIPSPYYIIN